VLACRGVAEGEAGYSPPYAPDLSLKIGLGIGIGIGLEIVPGINIA
jgi:hypothetical protein